MRGTVVSMNKFEIVVDTIDATMIRLTYWDTANNGVTFRMARADLQDLNTLINTYLGAH